MIADVLRLIRAEVLKLRAGRGQLILSAVLTSGMTLVVFAVLAILHASDPGGHGPAGGVGNFESITGDALTLLGIVVGTLLGATAGAIDDETGVLRDLVATGRSRRVLYAVRIPGMLAVLVPLLLVAIALAFAGGTLLAGSEPQPGLAELGDAVGGVVAGAVCAGAISLGIATLTGSRGPAIALTLGLLLVASTAVMQLSVLGDARAVLPSAAIGALGGADGMPVQLSSVGAIGVLLAWSALSLVAGERRAATAEL